MKGWVNKLLILISFFLALSNFSIIAIADQEGRVGDRKIIASGEEKAQQLGVNQPINLINALKNGIITLEIEGGENAVTITVKRVGKAEENLVILVPKGLTKLGFITKDKGITGGTDSTANIDGGVIDIKLFNFVKTMDFDRDGFSLELNQEALLNMVVFYIWISHQNPKFVAIDKEADDDVMHFL